jgi:3-methyladenine DNA glycosylase/8-oxoguanine DNA glycosylase
MRTSLALPTLFDADWTVGFLRAREVPSLETIGPRTIARAIRLDGTPLRLTVAIAARRASIEWEGRADAASVRAAVRRMLDLDTDLQAFHDAIGADRVLRSLVRARPALRVPQFVDPFECLVRAVIGQQVSVRGAATMVDRVVREFGEPVFPSPDIVAAASAERLRRVGLTRAKASAIVGIATAIAERRIDLEALRHVAGDEAQAALDALPGIGPWTASYVRMRALGDRDAFPAADLGIVKAMRAATGNDAITVAAIEKHASGWRPWRAYAAVHLWHAAVGRQPLFVIRSKEQ